MDRNDLITCFNDTFEISNSERLRDLTEKAKQSNRVYFENFVSNKNRSKHNAEIIVEANTTFAAAKKYGEFGKIAVLNFANPEVAGGGVTNGAMAQEECLCRSSNLYACINDHNVFSDYYAYHRNNRNYFYSDRLIYTKDVTVFKNDDEIPQMMPENEWFNVDVITCAAPYLGKQRHTNHAVLFDVYKNRIKNIFEAAKDNDIEVLILGAFGCGAFKNPPSLMAQAFYKVICEQEYLRIFKKIVFAIKTTGENCPNYNAFFSEFSGFMDMCCVLRDEMERFHKTPSFLNKTCLSEKYKFDNWQSQNKYFGKQFSILGDSISTLDGYNPNGYNLFYSGDNCTKSDVNEMKDTWWGKVIDFFGGELLVNNSWSGSRVTKLPNQESLFPSGCSEERTGNLHINTVNPDVIIVYLGTNDWANNVAFWPEDLSDIDLERARLLIEMDKFEDAYSYMLWKLRNNYPNAEIWCCTLCETYMSNNASFKFPHSFAGTHIDWYNDSIRKIVKDSNCNLIDLYNYHISYDTIDGTHPNESGMNTIAILILRAMAEETGKSFLDCEKEQHDFIVAEQYTGGTRYVCKKCGLERHTNTLGEIFCQCCKNSLSETEKFCPYCGSTIKAEDSSDRIEGPTPNGGEYAIVYYYDENGKSCSKDLAIRSIAQEFDKNGKMLYETFFDKVVKEENTPVKKSDFKWFEDAEYIELHKDATVILFDDTIKLFDEKEQKEIRIQKNKIDVGRIKELEIPIDIDAVSRRHASFLYENSRWYLIDHKTTNGTYINGQKIEPLKKYLLYENDIIDFAHSKSFIFAKNKNFINIEQKESNIQKTDTQTIDVGSVIDGKYKLLSLVGRGGCSKVYLAMNIHLNMPYAVKVYDKKAQYAESAIMVAHQELEIMKLLEHPAIPKVFDYIDLPDYLCIVQEYVSGETLQSLVNHFGAQPEELVIKWVKQLCDVLNYLHTRNPAIIYRDVKPHNIMLKPDGTIKLIDFGIARTYKPGKSADTVTLGTIGYAAPEQFGSAQTDVRTDIFGLGKTMHQLLTGLNPMEPPYETKPIRQINPALSQYLEDIIIKCTAPNPRDRYQNCEELLQALEVRNQKENRRSIFSKLFDKK